MNDRAMERVLALVEAGPDATQERRREIEAELHHDNLVRTMTEPAGPTLPIMARGAGYGGARKRPSRLPEA